MVYITKDGLEGKIHTSELRKLLPKLATAHGSIFAHHLMIKTNYWSYIEFDERPIRLVVSNDCSNRTWVTGKEEIKVPWETPYTFDDMSLVHDRFGLTTADTLDIQKKWLSFGNYKCQANFSRSFTDLGNLNKGSPYVLVVGVRCITLSAKIPSGKIGLTLNTSMGTSMSPVYTKVTNSLADQMVNYFTVQRGNMSFNSDDWHIDFELEFEYNRHPDHPDEVHLEWYWDIDVDLFTAPAVLTIHEPKDEVQGLMNG